MQCCFGDVRKKRYEVVVLRTRPQSEVDKTKFRQL